MKILITGGTGFIGRQLCGELLKNGQELHLVTRRKSKDWDLPTAFVEWDMEHEPPPQDLDPGSFDALIHLAGENISGGRWTSARMTRIVESRTKTTKALGRWLEKRPDKIPLVLSASAIGYYGNRPGVSLDESSPKGEGFLADVCEAWEEAVKALPAIREARFRFGVVLGQSGGFLQPLRFLTRLGLGAIVGSGNQRLSFIHRSDLIQAMQNALSDERYHGAINLVAPESTSQGEFQRALSRLMHRPAVFHIPSFLPRLVLGEMADLLLDSQDVVPKRLSDLGYRFRYPTLQTALAEALGR